MQIIELYFIFQYMVYLDTCTICDSIVNISYYPNWSVWFSFQFSHSVVSNSLWSHGLQHTRLPCPSPTLGACSNSCPSSRWCLPIISSSVIPISSYIQFFQHQGLFQWVSSSYLVAKVLNCYTNMDIELLSQRKDVPLRFLFITGHNAWLWGLWLSRYLLG